MGKIGTGGIIAIVLGGVVVIGGVYYLISKNTVTTPSGSATGAAAPSGTDENGYPYTVSGYGLKGPQGWVGLNPSTQQALTAYLSNKIASAYTALNAQGSDVTINGVASPSVWTPALPSPAAASTASSTAASSGSSSLLSDIGDVTKIVSMLA